MKTNLVIIACLSALGLAACGENPKSDSKAPASQEMAGNSCFAGSGDSILISHPRLRPLREGQAMTAGYFDLCNPTETPITLTGASADFAMHAELHETKTSEDGVAAMSPVDKFTIAPGDTVSFKPGGAHIMLIGIDGPIQAGETRSIVLQFDEADAISVDLTATNDLESPSEVDHSSH